MDKFSYFFCILAVEKAYLAVRLSVHNSHSNSLKFIYEGDPKSNANSCVISFTIAVF